MSVSTPGRVRWTEELRKMKAAVTQDLLEENWEHYLQRTLDRETLRLFQRGGHYSAERVAYDICKRQWERLYEWLEYHANIPVPSEDQRPLLHCHEFTEILFDNRARFPCVTDRVIASIEAATAEEAPRTANTLTAGRLNTNLSGPGVKPQAAFALRPLSNAGVSAPPLPSANVDNGFKSEAGSSVHDQNPNPDERRASRDVDTSAPFRESNPPESDEEPPLKRRRGRPSKRSSAAPQTPTPQRRPVGRPRKDGQMPRQRQVAAPAAPPDYAHPLLPSAEKYGSFQGLWDEEDVVLSWTEQDSQILEAAKTNTSEIAMFKKFVDIYNCLPMDLFRFGLQPYRSSKMLVLGDGIEVTNANMTPSLTKALDTLVTHRFFHGDVSKLRWALQVAVKYRVKDHASPVFATPSSPMVKTLWRNLSMDERPDMSAEQIQQLRASMLTSMVTENAEDSGPKFDQRMMDLSQHLYTTIKAVEASSDIEKYLFILQTADITAVTTALDSLEENGGRVWRYSAEEYKRNFLKGQKGMRSHRPLSQDELLHWKKECILAERRERLIRERLLQCQGYRRMHILPDAPSDDQDPILGTSKSISFPQRAVLAGWITTQGWLTGAPRSDDELPHMLNPQPRQNDDQV